MEGKCKMLKLQDLRHITVVGMGLLGSSAALAISKSLPKVRTIGYSHRECTRNKALDMGIVDKVYNTLPEAVEKADIVILASPIYTFKDVFKEIRDFIKPECIITDVGSTKVLPLRWAKQVFGKKNHYVGSHPIAGSEQRGMEYGRDDLFVGANCIITEDKDTDPNSAKLLSDFWAKLGSYIKVMSPVEHDRVFGRVSHLPHLTAVALMNTTSSKDMLFAGKGFIDTTRIASGPANVWSDILLANGKNSTKGIDGLIAELKKIKVAIENNDEKELSNLLDQARDKRSELIKMKIANGEII